MISLRQRLAVPRGLPGGGAIRFQAGDACLLPANRFGVWEIEETARKTSVPIRR